MRHFIPSPRALKTFVLLLVLGGLVPFVIAGVGFAFRLLGELWGMEIEVFLKIVRFDFPAFLLSWPIFLLSLALIAGVLVKTIRTLARLVK